MVMSMGYGTMIMSHGWFSGVTTSGSKSAVQLLQESKSRYVKSDRVLVSHQEPSRPDHLHISANPNIFLSASSHTLHVSKPSDTETIHKPSGAVPLIPPPIPPRNYIVTPLTKTALTQHLNAQVTGGLPLTKIAPPLPSRSHRATPRLRAKTQPVSDVLPRGGDLRRSLSHGPTDRTNTDVQMKLRKLLNTSSKESLHQDQRLRPSQNDEGTFRAEVAAVTMHKSLPELPSKGSPYKTPDERRPSCPGFISCTVSTPIPPPRPPRTKKNLSLKPPPRPPPPKILPRPLNRADDSGISVLSNLASSDDVLSADELCDVDQEETRRRPILRSKSDVTHERNGVLGGGTGSQWGDEESPRRSSYSSVEVEQFFDSMGLDCATLKILDSPNHSGSSSHIYFDEMSSEDSGGANAGARRVSSDSDEIKSPFNVSGLKVAGIARGAQSINMKRGLEPSIIEKNARVIKWLFNCQKARSVIIPRSLSSGS